VDFSLAGCREFDRAADTLAAVKDRPRASTRIMRNRLRLV